MADTYDGRRWSRTVDAPITDVTRGVSYAPAAPPVDHSTRQTITLSPLEGRVIGPGFIPVGLFPDRFETESPLTLDTEAWVVRSESSIDGPLESEVVVVDTPRDDLVDADVGSEGLEPYLSVPNSISRRVTVLAHDIAGRGLSPYSRAQALLVHLTQNYTDDFDYVNAPANREPTDWFLFEDRRGVCANFSNAFTIMARLVRLPAKPVAGWAIAPTAHEQTVTTGQAHQWVDLYFEGIGWVTFDPTPPGGPPSRVASSDNGTPRTGRRSTGDGETERGAIDPVPQGDVGPLATVVEITEVGGRARKGRPLVVRGTLVTNDGKPVGGQPV